MYEYSVKTSKAVGLRLPHVTGVAVAPAKQPPPQNPDPTANAGVTEDGGIAELIGVDWLVHSPVSRKAIARIGSTPIMTLYHKGTSWSQPRIGYVLSIC